VLIRAAEGGGHSPLDLRTVGGDIAEIGHHLQPRGEERVIDAAGGALIPGLHDHHIHLLALAAAESSVVCGPPEVGNASELAAAIGAARSAASSTRDRSVGDWIRGVGYHESVAGPLDREALDRLESHRPLRIQHRSGQAWLLNSAAIEVLGIDRGADNPGVQRDSSGRANGTVLRADVWLRRLIATEKPPCLAGISQRLASYGVTGITDATATNGLSEIEIFEHAIAMGELRQRLVLMGGLKLEVPQSSAIELGAVKLILDERELPELDAVVARIAEAHHRERGVAIHCVTRAELVLATAALSAAGSDSRDRIEHASVAPPELIEAVAALGASVVTQPGFIFSRGDAYLNDVDDCDLPWLYRGTGFTEAGVALGGGSDAPFGDADPWITIRAAVNRRTRGGDLIGSHEALTPERSLALFTTAAQAPGATTRELTVGAPAHLCLLDRPWREARQLLSSRCVVATVAGGELIWQRQHSSNATLQLSSQNALATAMRPAESTSK